MNDSKFYQNPQISFSQNRSGIMKSPQKIGRIYFRTPQTKLHESAQSSNFHSQSTQLPLKHENGFANSSPLLSNKFLHHIKAFRQQNFSHTEIGGQISPVTTKSFRINKMYSSEVSSPFVKKKTPELIGKLSKSKLNIEIYEQEPCIKRSKVSKSRSPGHFTSRKQGSHLRQRKQIQPIQNQIEKLLLKQPTQLSKQAQREQIISEVDSQNRRLIEQVKQKQRYLKSLIEKHRREVKSFASQLPVTKKNVQQFKYSYPVSSNKGKSRMGKKASPYLQKIEQNSKMFQGMLVSPKGLSKDEKLKNPAKKNSIPIVRKSHRIDDGEEILQKSAMRISPQVNVSFTIKSPKKLIEESQVFKSKDSPQNQIEQTLPLSRVSVYSPQKNLDFNNRKPKYVSLLIDPIQSQYEKYKLEAKQPGVDIQKYSEYFARNRSFTQNSSQNIKQVSSSQRVSLSLSTSTSAIKQLLIQSSQTLNLTFLLPSCLFNNMKVTPSTQTSYLHLFIQKIYHELKIKPEIITLKKYNNAMFTGVLLNGSNDSDLENQFMSVIYHFDQVIYVGKWKEKKGYFKNQTNKVQGYKHGMGLEILYGKKTIPSQNGNQHNQSDQVMFEIYYGQFQNNIRQGYGIKISLAFQNHKIKNQQIEIGCWQNNLRHGWIKTYQNSKLIQNAEYVKNIKKTQRHLNKEDLPT